MPGDAIKTDQPSRGEALRAALPQQAPGPHTAAVTGAHAETVPAAAPQAESAPPAATVAGALPGAEPQQRVVLHMPVDVRSASLVVLAVIASLFALRVAAAVFIPVLLGLMFSYALSPIVDRLEKWRLPRGLGSALVVVSVVALISWTGRSLSDDANSLIESLPRAAEKLRHRIVERQAGAPPAAITKVQEAAAELEKVAEASASAPAAPARGVAKVQIEKPKFDVKEYLWSGTLGLITLAGQATMVVFITYFIMAAGDRFRRKLAKIAGPTFAKRKITVEALKEITEQIQRYLMVQLVTSVLVGVATGAAFWYVGLEHSMVWGIAAGVLNLIPYVGALLLTGAASLHGLLQFDSLDKALLVGAVSMGIHIVSGYIVTPWLTSRASRMSPVVVFVGVLAWGWLWGMWGLLLGIPILMVVKAVCDRIEDLKPIGELLGD